ncbi:hypothetical protein [Microbacterium sp. zg.Y909]|nr:hypothetical protein [Microbacterium sp. zg.Y909]
MYFFPTEPGDDRLELTVRSGEVWFHWCGSRSMQEGLRLSFRAEPPGGHVTVAYEGSGSFVLEPGGEFAVAAPPHGLRATTESISIPATDELERVTVSSGGSTPTADSILTTFNIDHIDDLEGVWLRIDGSTAQVPCSDESGD